MTKESEAAEGRFPKVNVDAKLATDRFKVDEGNAHIVLKEDADPDEFHKLTLCCPASLYSFDENGRQRFGYSGCLECGACRILCGDTILEKWTFPQGGMGVEYRFG